MGSMNEDSCALALRNFMDGAREGWGRAQGREVYPRLLDWVESQPGAVIFRVSLEGIGRMDLSFASETLVELARRFRGSKGFFLVDVPDADVLENLDAAAARKGVAMMVRKGSRLQLIGASPSEGNRGALEFALAHRCVRAAEFAEARRDMSIANASTKFKQLWEQGFLLRQESVADSGGVEYQYRIIG